jgi:hypothetical protein
MAEPSRFTRRYDARYQARHAGHRVIETAAQRKDGRPYRQCLTCAPWRTPKPPVDRTPDDAAIARAVAGNPPSRLLPAERRAAILQLRPALPVPVIAEVVRCSERTVWRALAAARDAA